MNAARECDMRRQLIARIESWNNFSRRVHMLYGDETLHDWENSLS